MTTRETMAGLALWIAVLGVNFATITRSPTVWNDEVFTADPAVNFSRGGGFRSTAWDLVGEEKFWPGVVPLYGFALGGWLRLAGEGMVQVRALPILLAAFAALWIWRTARVRGHAATPGGGLLLLALLLCASGASFSYRGARPDALGMLWWASVYAAGFSPRPAARAAGLVLAGLAAPWCGLSLLPPVAIGAAALLYSSPREWLGRITMLGLGLALGSVLLAAVFRAAGSWDVFVACARGYQQGILSAAFCWKLGGLKDPGFVALALLAVMSCAAGIRRGEGGRPPIALVLFAAATPFVLAVSGKFPAYYSWMVCFPLVVAAPSMIALLPPGVPRAAGLACAAAAIVSGLPLRTALAALEWRARDYGQVEDFVARHFTAEDRVVCDHPAYYPLKRRVAALYPRTCAQLATVPARARAGISSACLGPEVRESELDAVFGGRWARVAELAPAQGFLGRPPPYRLAVFRKSGEGVMP